MSRTFMTAGRTAFLGGALLIGVGLAFSAHSQTAPAREAGAGPSPARQAVEARRATFLLIGDNFRLLGNVLKGAVAYDSDAVQKRIVRLAFLSDLVSDAFPEISNIGEPDTKAKGDIWVNRADFDKKLKEFQTHVVALQKVNDADKSATDAFKTAATAVAQDCKACHDDYRLK